MKRQYFCSDGSVSRMPRSTCGVAAVRTVGAFSCASTGAGAAAAGLGFLLFAAGFGFLVGGFLLFICIVEWSGYGRSGALVKILIFSGGQPRKTTRPTRNDFATGPKILESRL